MAQDLTLLRYRPAVPSDAEEVASVTRAANAEYRGRYDVSALFDPSAQDLADLRRGGGQVAETAGVLVGAVRYVRGADGSASLRRLAVAPACRRRGVGGGLVREAERMLIEVRVGRVTLATVAEVRDLDAFYQDLGYRPTGTEWVARRGFTPRYWTKDLEPTRAPSPSEVPG